MRSWMNHTGAFLLILIGIVIYSWAPDFPSAGAPTLALLLLIAGLVWGGLALDNPLRERRYYRWPRDGSLRAGYRSHRSSKHVAAGPFAGAYLRPYGAQAEKGGVAMNAPAVFAGGSFVKDSLRIATREMKENLCGARCSMWAVLSGIVLTLMSADLLLTGREFSLLEQSQVLYIVTSLAIGLGLLVAGILAADSVANEKERATLRGALLLGKVWGVFAAWLLIFVISVPYILVVGFGTSVSWAALIYTFVLGSLCVAGFASLIVGISALSRSGRGVTLATAAVFIVIAAPTLLGTTMQKSWFSSVYNVLSPVAHARLSLDSVIVDRESLLVQLPHIGALAVFAAVAAVFAVLAARGGSLERRRGA